MITSDRFSRLGSGVFDRNDRRKAAYVHSVQHSDQALIDLSLGSTDLAPPADAVEAMASALRDPSRRHTAAHKTRPTRG